MIIFQKPDGESRSCNCCYSKEKVLDVLFQADGHGTVVALCDKCRKELAEKLTKLTEEEGK